MLAEALSCSLQKMNSPNVLQGISGSNEQWYSHTMKYYLAIKRNDSQMKYVEWKT
jgi:hypothetical protein